MALRPLGLGDMFDGAFRIIRFNPRATVGAALLVSAVAMALPVLAAAVLTPAVGAATDLGDPFAVATGGGAALTGGIGALGAQLLAALALQVGLVLVTGMVAHVTHDAALGRKIGLGEAWARTRGTRWRLLGLAVLVNVPFLIGFAVWAAVVVGFAASGPGLAPLITSAAVGGLVLLVVGAWYYVRCVLLAAVALALERVGVGAAVVRAFRLSSRQVWRLLGIALVTVIVTGIASLVLGVPLAFAGQAAASALPAQAALVLAVGQALSTVATTAFTAPFTASVTTLQYLDQRMRKEAYDVELATRAGIG